MLKSNNRKLLFFTVGFLSGLTNGLLGAGGGIIVTYFLDYAIGKNNPQKNQVFSTALATMLPLSAVSAIMYFTKGHISPEKSMLTFILPALLGGALGGILLKKLNFKLLKIIFTAIVIYSGFSMIN